MKLKNGYNLIEYEDYFKVLSPDGTQIRDFNLSTYERLQDLCLQDRTDDPKLCTE